MAIELKPEDGPESLADFGVGQVSNVKVQDALADHVNRSFTEAKMHRTNIGITDRLLRNLRAKRCEYQPDEVALLGPFNDVYIGIAALKARAAESWLIDIIVNNIDKPWMLQATPDPDLPDRLKDQVIDALVAELPSFATFDALKDRATQLKSAVQSIAAQAADASIKRMETRIDDQLTEGDWLDTYSKFVGDLTVYPTAMIRGPVEIGVPQPYWDGNKYKVRTKSLLTTRVISPFNAYPSPNATTTQDGNYFIEVVEYTHSDIHDLMNVPSFSTANIRQVLEQYKEGYRPTRMEDSQRDYLEEKGTGLQLKTGLETRIYNGKIKGEMLRKHGVLISDPQKHYECEIWVIGEYVIRAVLNPSPVGQRPVYGTSYIKVNNAFWGESVIDSVYDVGRICNAACRSMVRNMGYSSGPIGEVVSDRLADGDDPSDLQPYKIFNVGPDMSGTGAPAFKFHNVGSIANELLAVFNQYMKIADDLSGVPAYVLGSPQVAGAGRTLGGLSMLMGNAAKGIKNVQLNIDREIISQIVQNYYYYNMLTSTDNGIKADAKVVARGATGLLQRELSQAKSTEILQLLTPYVQQGLVDKTAISYLLRNILQNTGLDVDKVIPNPDQASSVSELSQLLGGPATAGTPPQTQQALNTGTSTPQPLPTQSQPPAESPQTASIPQAGGLGA